MKRKPSLLLLSGESASLSVCLLFTDTDGAANGGEFSRQRMEVTFTEKDPTAPASDTDPQVVGSFARSDVDITLDREQ